MATYGRTVDPAELMRRVKPPTGFPVVNAGGIPQTPMVAPKPAVKMPSVAAGSPGPEPTQAPTPSPVPTPAPVPAPVSAPAPAPEPAPAPATPPAGDPLEAQIGDYITKALGGGAGAWDAAAISRAKAGAKSASEGQRRATVDVGNEDLAQRGMFRSGLGARMASDAARGAGASYTQAVADMMNQKAAADQQARESGLQAALGLYQTKTGNALQQAQIDASHAGGGPQYFDYTDPESGETYSLPMSMLE